MSLNRYTNRINYNKNKLWEGILVGPDGEVLTPLQSTQDILPGGYISVKKIYPIDKYLSIITGFREGYQLIIKKIIYLPRSIFEKLDKSSDLFYHESYFRNDICLKYEMEEIDKVFAQTGEVISPNYNISWSIQARPPPRS